LPWLQLLSLRQAEADLYIFAAFRHAITPHIEFISTLLLTLHIFSILPSFSFQPLLHTLAFASLSFHATLIAIFDINIVISAGLAGRIRQKPL